MVQHSGSQYTSLTSIYAPEEVLKVPIAIPYTSAVLGNVPY